MEQLRIYTLTDKSTAEPYFREHWTKRLESLPKFGVQVKGVWIGQRLESENQVIALVSFPDNTNIDETTERYMKSAEFADDMVGFDKSKITHVETKVMKSA
ncbi:NIPSNAP family protein [Mucilaginibacter sp.]|uniref:NIPSNAP family protein n=1 Tax=Mucilaginibacter sp. TaxID=1882438 RepID=UPI00284E855E|nr:NIPSNAP family protein [Mucilaginibacter sp.]MDR3696190.1 NIPSNAP family protein [Mucilaginibacter sp.]